LAGIYLHIPFCRQACHYCNFHFTTSLRYKDDVVNAIVREVELRKEYLSGQSLDTIYFGGGTPSLLTASDLEKLLSAVKRNFKVNAKAEITLEANPDDITKEKLEEWKGQGINRLSIGVQSFIDNELKWMNRAHNAQHARQCIELSLATGFNNISIDLIYGSPLLDDESWEKNVAIATGYSVPHLSCYALTVEEKTPLHKQITGMKGMPVDEEKQARQFILLMQWLRDAGYEHYEVSNFAKPGFQSRHNSAYWKGSDYLGLGPSAHSFNGKERSWNPANNQAYARNIIAGILPVETETLTEDQLVNENIMISLRTSSGLDLNQVEAKWGANEKERIMKLLSRYISHNLLLVENNIATLTDAGMLRADGIAADLFR
jgi:oxygen-independent coproporphyrinogen III oxidase